MCESEEEKRRMMVARPRVVVIHSNCMAETEGGTLQLGETEGGTLQLAETEGGTLQLGETEGGTLQLAETEGGTLQLAETDGGTGGKGREGMRKLLLKFYSMSVIAGPFYKD